MQYIYVAWWERRTTYMFFASHVLQKLQLCQTGFALNRRNIDFIRVGGQQISSTISKAHHHGRKWNII